MRYLRANRDLHLIINGIAVETLLFQSLQDSDTSIESLKALWYFRVRLRPMEIVNLLTVKGAPSSLILPSSVKMLMKGKLWRFPIWKSFKSWAGVILTAPVIYVSSCDNGRPKK
jgi:hypothetical protein